MCKYPSIEPCYIRFVRFDKVFGLVWAPTNQLRHLSSNQLDSTVNWALYMKISTNRVILNRSIRLYMELALNILLSNK